MLGNILSLVCYFFVGVFLRAPQTCLRAQTLIMYGPPDLITVKILTQHLFVFYVKCLKCNILIQSAKTRPSPARISRLRVLLLW